MVKFFSSFSEESMNKDKKESFHDWLELELELKAGRAKKEKPKSNPEATPRHAKESFID